MRWNSLGLKKKIWIVIGLLFLLMIGLFWMPEEGEGVKYEREKWVCYIAMKKIGTAICQYAEKEGQGIFYPKSLQELVDKKYLSEAILHCTPNLSYQYIPGLRINMPANLPLLIEMDAPHRSNSHQASSEKFGFVMFNDFSVYLMLKKNEAESILVSAKKSVELSECDNPTQLISILKDYTTAGHCKATILWKLRQLNYEQETDFLSNFFNSKFPEVARQTALLLQKKVSKKSNEIIAKNLASNNYWLRRDTWKSVFPKDTSLHYISPDIAVQKFWQVYSK